MEYRIVAGKEMKKLLKDRFYTIPFNEDMNKGSYSEEPFSIGFIKERSKVHKVTTADYINNTNEFLSLLPRIKDDDTIHLYFGNDKTCIANRRFLINYLKDKVNQIVLHIVNEYTGEEISQSIV